MASHYRSTLNMMQLRQRLSDRCVRVFLGSCCLSLLIATPSLGQPASPPRSEPLEPEPDTIPLNPEKPPADLSFPETPSSAPLPNRPNLPPAILNQLLGNPSPIAPVFDDYRLGPGDSIFVGVQRFPDLSFQATLDITGNVVVPLAGAINLSGLTLDQARERVYEAYNQYVVEPEVSLTLTALRAVEVTIVGEVSRPGYYPLTAPQIATALLTAGGSTMMADLREVTVQRTLSNGDRLDRTVDLFTPLKDGEPLPDVRLQNGDVIVVPRLDLTRLDDYDRNLVANSTLAKPEITVRVLNYAGGRRGIDSNLGGLTLRNGSRFLDAFTQIGVNPERANLGQVALVRFNPEKGEAETIMVNAGAAINGDISQNIPLQDNDVLIFDRNAIAQVTYALDTFTQPFRDILGFLLFFDSIANTATNLFQP